MRKTLVLLFACAACGPTAPNAAIDSGSTSDDPDASSNPPPPPPPMWADAAPIETCDKMDILFVIDDSGSMGEEQANLTANFPGFIQVLDAYTNSAGVPLDYRVGVTTTGVDVEFLIQPIPGFPAIPESEEGPDGQLLQKADCGMTRRWIERSDPDVSGTFSCLANVGTSGSAMEMPLRATELAVTDRVLDGTNAGFIREDALLAVIILTDENDCSRDISGFTVGAADECSEPPALLPPAQTVTKLDEVKGDRGRWATAVIAGPNDCSSEFGSADDAQRLEDFVAAAGTNAVFSSICAGDLTGALMDALETFDQACEMFPPIE